MTLVVTILIGVGAVLISSAIDCSDIPSTFMKIINNQPIDWTGNACSGTGSPAQNVGTAQQKAWGPSSVPPGPGKTCPPGYIYVIADNQCHHVGIRP